jgi:hypothetical protein
MPKIRYDLSVKVHEYELNKKLDEDYDDHRASSSRIMIESCIIIKDYHQGL